MSAWGTEAERVFHKPPEVTEERADAWQRWVDDYAFGCAERWIAQGTLDSEALDAAMLVHDEWLALDAEEWMPLGLANAHHLSAALSSPDKPLVGDERTAYMQSVRTRATASEHEMILATAYQLGVSPAQARKIVGDVTSTHPPEAARGSKTALYRYFDAGDVLLYVGITKNADLRDEQHRKASGWHPLSARRTLTWFDDRAEADLAERQAIASELPLFNTTHSTEATKARAIKYLLERVPVAAGGAA